MSKNVLVSGIKPSSESLTIGNYLGAIQQWVLLQHEYDSYFFIADSHAITIPQEPKKLTQNSLTFAALLIACGINPAKSTLFIQSHISAHFELAWILTTLTPLGELERMTQFKEKSDKSGQLAGLLNYPVLQAADILLYGATAVPVGEDQLQHLELARTLVRKFNNSFGDTFTEPKGIVIKETARIMGLDDPSKKMGKTESSTNNFISLLDAPEEIRKKIKVAVTDSGSDIRYNEKEKPAISNLMTMYSSMSGVSLEDIEKQFTGKTYADFKSELAERIVEKLAPIQETYYELRKDDQNLLKILRDGADKARSVANTTLTTVRKAVGFIEER